MKVQELMSRDPKVVRPEMNVSAACELMWSNDCGYLPVVDAQGKVIGVLTDRDICIALGTRDARPSELRIDAVMQTDVATCGPGEPVDAALKKMRTRKIRRLPVVDSAGRIAGILAMNDVILHAQPGGDGKRAIPYENVMVTLQGVCEHGRSGLHAHRAAA